MWWCPWYKHTGRRVRHRNGAVGEIVYEAPRDFMVQLSDGFVAVWFKENCKEIRDLEGGG